MFGNNETTLVYQPLSTLDLAPADLKKYVYVPKTEINPQMSLMAASEEKALIRLAHNSLKWLPQHI